MSDATRGRIAILLHRRAQTDASRLLSCVSSRVGEAPHTPVDSEQSVQVQRALYSQLAAMRAAAELGSARYGGIEEAVAEFMARAGAIPPDAIAEFYRGAKATGFFVGPFSSAFLKACLADGYEGVALVNPDLKAGVVMDAALHDPLLGSFYELEWW